MTHRKKGTNMGQGNFMFVLSNKPDASKGSSSSTLGADYRSARYNLVRQKLAKSLPSKK